MANKVKVYAAWVGMYSGSSAGMSGLKYTQLQVDSFLSALQPDQAPVLYPDQAPELDPDQAPMLESEQITTLEHGDADASSLDFTPGEDGTTLINGFRLAYYSGHGDTDGPVFLPAAAGPPRIPIQQARLGDSLRWLVFDACKTMQWSVAYNPIDRWRGAFQGLTCILGFTSESSDEVYRGKYFAEFLKEGLTIREAWRRACQETEWGDGARWSYLRAGNEVHDTADDTWVGAPDDPVTPESPTFFLWFNASC